MQDLLMKKGPLAVCLNADPMQLYTSGVSNPKTCDPKNIGTLYYSQDIAHREVRCTLCTCVY